MSENLDQLPVKGDGTLQENTPQYTEIEQRALEMGWRPKDDFSGNEEDFIDAKEFVRRQPLYDKIHKQSGDIKELRRAMEAFKTHFTTVQEAAYQKALRELKDQRKDALANGDGDRFEQLDEEIKSAQEQVAALKAAKETPIVQDTPTEHPEFSAWKTRNRWYDSTGYMRTFADDYGTRLAAQGVPPNEVLKQVEQAVRKEFPHKFSNPNKDLAPNVNSSNNRGKVDSFEASLDATERRIMDSLVRSGIKKEDYLAQLKAVKGIK